MSGFTWCLWWKVKTDITIYHNKVEQSATVDNDPNNFSPGSGATVIGKFGILYGTVTVDELAMWNRALSEAEVDQLYNMVTE